MPREKLSIEIPAYAKINLFLDIEGTRPDGYHTLSMVNAKISLHDIVSCSITLKSQIELTCTDPGLPTDKQNVAYQAAARFREQSRFGKGISIHIDKRIPVGAGLAGGSTDAAAVLMALNQLTYDRVPIVALRSIAEGLGADVPFFFERGICVCTGIGERIVPVNLPVIAGAPPVYGVLCSPKESVSTQAAYRLWDEMDHSPHASSRNLIDTLTQQRWSKIPQCMFNAFESVIFKAYPGVYQVYRIFCDVSPTEPRMTGSGSNLFSLHTSETEASEVVEKLRENDLTAVPFQIVL